MVKRVLLLLLLLSAGGNFAATADEPEKTIRIAFFQDPSRGQWCAYRDRKVANAMIQKIGANNVGTFYYTDKHLVQINYEKQNESGDSIVSDDYFLDGDGNSTRFERHTNTFHGNVSALEIYSVENGKFRRTGVRYFDLSTRKAIRKPQGMDPEPGQPFRKDLKELPFYPLTQASAILVDAKSCIARH